MKRRRPSSVPIAFLVTDTVVQQHRVFARGSRGLLSPGCKCTSCECDRDIVHHVDAAEYVCVRVFLWGFFASESCMGGPAAEAPSHKPRVDVCHGPCLNGFQGLLG